MLYVVCCIYDTHRILRTLYYVLHTSMSVQPTAAVTGLQIPADTQQKFGAIIAMIMGSESMNMEERQYWINILPVMTPEQLRNLKDILECEKRQLADIDAKYATSASKVNTDVSTAEIENKIRARKRERQEQEHAESEKEEVRESDILAQIQAV